ncbi:hypothetical protein [Dongia sp. agr-C8]
MHPKFPPPRAFAAAALLTALLAPPLAQAEPIPPALLAADHRSCVATCTSHAVALASCTQYCDCTFQGVAEQFTLEEYKAAGNAAGQDQPPPAALIERMAGISRACAARLQ